MSITAENYLHITTGDSSAQPLLKSDIPGDVLVWREIYVEGPVPGNVSQHEFISTRARHISNSMGLSLETVTHELQTMYDKLRSAESYGEIIVWYDPCMFCQTIIMHILSQLRAQSLATTSIRLVSFALNFDWSSKKQIDDLFNSRSIATEEIMRLATSGWEAFTSDTPNKLLAFIRQEEIQPLSFVQAMKRHLQQFPSTLNGLSRTQHQILEAVRDGNTTPGCIFRAIQTMEEQPYLGDISCWHLIAELAQGNEPLLTISGPNFSKLLSFNPDGYTPPTPEFMKQWIITLTHAGKKCS